MHTTAPDFGADCGKAIGFGAIRDACRLNGPVDKPIVIAIVTHHTFSRLAHLIVCRRARGGKEACLWITNHESPRWD